MDPEKRAAYDHMGRQWGSGQDFQSAAGPAPHAGAHARGRDYHAQVMIDLEDAYSAGSAASRCACRSWMPRAMSGSPSGGLTPASRGASAPGGSGDHCLEIGFNAHPRFRVAGREIYFDLPLSPWEAA